MKKINITKTITLITSLSALLLLSGCGTEGTQSTHQLVGGTITPKPPLPPKPKPPLPPSNEGKNFHLGFMENYTGEYPLNLQLYISSREGADVTITLFGDVPVSFEKHVDAHQTISVDIDAEMEQKDIGKQTKGIKITSNNNIVVVGLNQEKYTTDAYLALPDQILSKEYYAVSYTSLISEEFSIVATEDNTTISFEAPENSDEGVSVSEPIVLNEGETYQFKSTDNLTGTHVTGDKNFVLLSGNVCTDVPSGYSACDHLTEMIPPVDTWEKQFITLPLATRTKGDSFRILASVDNTTIKIDGETITTINKGAFYETVLEGAKYIEADHPILVVQYSNSSSYDDVTSDPFMAIVPAINQFDTEHLIQTPNGFTNYVNIVVPTANTSDIALDDTPIESSQFTQVSANSQYSYAQISISEGAHKVTGNVPFGLSGYGYADYDSYGYPSTLKLTKH